MIPRQKSLEDVFSEADTFDCCENPCRKTHLYPRDKSWNPWRHSWIGTNRADINSAVPIRPRCRHTIDCAGKPITPLSGHTGDYLFCRLLLLTDCTPSVCLWRDSSSTSMFLTGSLNITAWMVCASRDVLFYKKKNVNHYFLGGSFQCVTASHTWC